VAAAAVVVIRRVAMTAAVAAVAITGIINLSIDTSFKSFPQAERIFC
jgi:hypothetical protein